MILIIGIGTLSTESGRERLLGTPEAWLEQNSFDQPPAYKGQDWYFQYQQDAGWVFDDPRVWRPLRTDRVADIESRTINVRDGNRVTWMSPPCECERLQVWVYGGSTVFGLGQRDEHTIASELARVAFDAGYDLEVTNRGVPGYQHWQEAQAFAWDVVTEGPPDVVIFYDGVNEIATVQELQTNADTKRLLDPLEIKLWNDLAADSPDFYTPDGASVIEETPLERDPVDLGELAASHYDLTRKLSRDVATLNDIPILWFWQPSQFSRPPRGDEFHLAPEDQAWRSSQYETAESNVPPGVVDVTDIFDDVDEPLFTDEVHHNERGARIVAERLFVNLQPELDLARSPGSGS